MAGGADWLAPAYDEVYGESGVPRAHYDDVLSSIMEQGPRALRRRVDWQVARRGVSFGGDGGPPFAIDPVPRVIAAEEWSMLEAATPAPAGSTSSTAGPWTTV